MDITNKELAQLLIETADVLGDKFNNSNTDNMNIDTITEGILGKIALSYLGFIAVSIILAKISIKVDFNKNKKTLTGVSEYKQHLSALERELNKIKFVSYKPSVKAVIKENISLIKSCSEKLKSLDNKLYGCKTPDEFDKLKSSLSKEYLSLYNDTKKKLTVNNSKINTREKDITDMSIIQDLKKYLYCFNNEYYRNLDGDDFWESIKFMKDLYTSSADDGSIFNSYYEKVYDCLCSFPEYSVLSIKGFMEPLKYIKVQFKGKEPKTQNETIELTL